jgi:putative ABC transport system substrate-binding protein
MLLPYAEGDPQAQARLAAIKKSLGELGWTEGRNIAFHFRWATNDPGRLQAHAAELVKLSPDVIVTPSTPATSAVQKLTSVIPIVLSTSSIPSPAALSKAWRGRAATSPVSAISNLRSAASGSSISRRSRLP